MNRATLRVWDDDACRRVHQASLTLLERTGVDVKDERARELCAAAGAAVDGRRVRLPAGARRRRRSRAPRAPGRCARAAARRRRSSCATAPATSAAARTASTSPTRRRASGGARVLADVEAAARVAEALPNIDFVMSMALPDDVANEVVDVVQFGAMLRGTRKPIVVSSPFGGETLYTMHADGGGLRRGRQLRLPRHELAAAACSTTSAAPRRSPAPTSTSRWCWRRRVSAGAQGPASLTACVAVANAEVLAGLVVHQLGKAGAPFVMGVGTGVMNMQSAVEVYNSPGVFLGNQAQLDLIRWYGLPSWHYAGHSDSKALDEQWALEVGIATIMGALSRATLLHDVGYLESGLQSALEGLVLGDEVAGYARALLAELPVDDEALALAEIEAVGPGGNHLGTKMTRRHFRDFWRASLIDQSTYDRWSAAGSPTLLERVRARLAEIRGGGPGVHPRRGDAADARPPVRRRGGLTRPGRRAADEGANDSAGGGRDDERRGRRGLRSGPAALPRTARAHPPAPLCRYPSSPGPG